MGLGNCRRLRAGEGLTANHCNIPPLILLPNRQLSRANRVWQRNGSKPPKSFKASERVTWLLDGADFFMTSNGDIILLNHSHGSNSFGGVVSPVGFCLNTPKEIETSCDPRHRILEYRSDDSHRHHPKRRGGLCL